WRGSRLPRELTCLLLTWAYTVPVLLGLGMVTTFNAQITYTSKLSWIVATPLLLLATRIALRKLQQALRARGLNTRRVAVCGANTLGVQLARNLANSPELGLRVTGFYDDRPAERIGELPRDVASL